MWCRPASERDGVLLVKEVHILVKAEERVAQENLI